MKLFDIYKSKKDDNLIQIDSFASHIKKEGNSHIVVYKKIEEINGAYGSSPSFNGYGTKEEIEEEYELLVKQEDLDKYETWEDILKIL